MHKPYELLESLLYNKETIKKKKGADTTGAIFKEIKKAVTGKPISNLGNSPVIPAGVATSPYQPALFYNLIYLRHKFNEKGENMKDLLTPDLRRELDDYTKYHIKSVIGRSFPKQKLEQLRKWNIILEYQGVENE